MIEREAKERLVVSLRRNDESAFLIYRHADPGAFAELGGMEQLGFETGQQRQALGRSRLFGFKHITPRFISHFSDGFDAGPSLCCEIELLPTRFLFGGTD